MLLELNIKNFAIIEQLDVEFQPRMTVLTGETGAGKSIIIDAVGLLAGGRGSASMIRTGADRTELQGAFSFPKDGATYQMLDSLGIDHADGSVILEREIHANGRNVCRVNGKLVNTTTLKQIGETAVDIHGQNEHQDLMQPEKHLGLLDEFAGAPLETAMTDYTSAYEKYVSLKRAAADKNANQKEWAQRLDMLRFQVDEISQANLLTGEEETLGAERDKLDHAQQIHDALSESLVALSGEEEVNGGVDAVGAAMAALQSIEDLDPAFKEISSSVSSSFYALQDAANDISRQADLVEFDDARLDDIEQRLELITQLKRKYGDSIAQILSYYNEISDELAEMEQTEDADNDLAGYLAEAEKLVQKQAKKLTIIRQKAAKALTIKIHEELGDLYMSKTEFSVHMDELPAQQYSSTGTDKLEFYLRTNPGEDFHPLAKIASGGELSRIMLAMKTIFSESQGVTSIIFDEVDTGVSGRVAQAIAEKISGIAKSSQVLCITHLPQVAAMADHHYFIAKNIVGKRTETTLTYLDDKARVQEIARMSAGTEVTKLALEHAEELLDLAEKAKNK